MRQVELSVITVVLNDIAGLKVTEASLACQKNRSFEWIVVDGGSIDGSVEYIRSSATVSRYISEGDRGIYDAMQKGLYLAHGEWIHFLNAGDRLSDQDALSAVSASLDGADVYFFSCRQVGLGKPYVRTPRPLVSAAYSVPAIQQATVYRRKSLLALEWPVSYRICGDYAIAAQLLRRGVQYACIDRVISDFSFGGISTVHPFRLAIEAFQVQSRVLQLPVRKKVIYLVRRLLTGWAVLILYKLRRSGLLK